MANLVEQAALLVLISRSDQQWYKTATLVEEAGSALRILRDTDARPDGADPVATEIDRQVEQIQEWAQQGLRLLTVLDSDYPINLREVYNRPPFLFVRGRLRAEDSRALAVVGTRSASEDGLALARQVASDLARQGVTVLSGMALGIDTAAHEAALQAGGRTVAVFGTGINRIYPRANKDLAARILQSGAHVSQFWPDAPPTRFSFPMRNVVSSGMALGTVVVEANGTSGARMQARLCLEHGKRLFLLRPLVMHEDWALRYAERPGATVVDSVDDVIGILDQLLDPPVQLSLC